MTRITTDMVDVETMTVSQRDALGNETYSTTGQVVGKVAGGAITICVSAVPSQRTSRPRS